MTLNELGYEARNYTAFSDVHVPSVLIVTDNEHGASAARQSVEAAGCRLIGEFGVDQARERLLTQVSLDVVMFECTDISAADLTALITDLDQVAARRQPVALVSTAFEGLDAYSGLLNQDNVTLLCAPDIADRIVELKLATLPQSFTLNDSSTDIESMRLQRLADEVGRIAKTLASLSGTGRTAFEAAPRNDVSTGEMRDGLVGFRAEPATQVQSAEGPSANDLRNMIRMRRMRDQFFGSELFADPAWDMLLDLLAARLEYVQVAVSSLCIASAVPPTTALRWIKTMCDSGLFERISDPDDGRRIFIRLSDTATDAMTRYWKMSERYQPRMM